MNDLLNFKKMGEKNVENIQTQSQNTDVFSEKLNPGKTFIMALQHVLTMCPGSLALIVILGNAIGLDAESITFMISANLFTNGLAILAQVYGVGNRIGSRLPIILGSSYAPLGAMIAIGKQYDIQVLLGSIIGSAILLLVLSLFLDKILKLFPPVVVGSFVTLIGISLAKVSLENIAGGHGAENYGSTSFLILGIAVAVVVLIVERFGGKKFKTMALLIGMLAGTGIATAMGIVDVTPVTEANWIQIVRPFYFGIPEFKVGPTLIMTVFCLVNLIQCIGVFSVLDEVAGTKTSEELKIKGLRGQAFSQLIGGIFNSVPGSMFSENVGLMNLTGVKSRSVIKTAGFILVVFGLVPKLAAAITVIPKPVLGGTTLILFGIITASGLSILGKLNMKENHNFTIVGTSMILGVASMFVNETFTNLPPTLAMLVGEPLFVVSASAIVLNLVLNVGHADEKIKEKAKGMEPEAIN